uniref:Uncharacterized protein n=1 Tax=Pithovirus LCPAC406 TaxID=2506599 RepID=A0A481ZE76_9VIRU|nr:MAG: hypothetical protein LCPAC406_00390 [Pithovirus LCPAC406]
MKVDFLDFDNIFFGGLVTTLLGDFLVNIVVTLGDIVTFFGVVNLGFDGALTVNILGLDTTLSLDFLSLRFTGRDIDGRDTGVFLGIELIFLVGEIGLILDGRVLLVNETGLIFLIGVVIFLATTSAFGLNATLNLLRLLRLLNSSLLGGLIDLGLIILESNVFSSSKMACLALPYALCCGDVILMTENIFLHFIIHLSLSSFLSVYPSKEPVRVK